MAAILRSSVIQTVRRAFSGEGTLSVRTLHTGRNNPMAYASCAKQNLKPAEDELLTKSDAIGKRGSASRYSRRPTRAKKTDDSGLKAIPWFLGIFLVLSFLEGYEVGKCDDEKPREG